MVIPSALERLLHGGLRLDLENRCCTLIWEDHEVPPTSTQADLALVFLESPDQMITWEHR